MTEVVAVGGALDGLRVLDLTRLLPGPFATMFLADHGAEVIKIEDVEAGDYLRGMPPLDGNENSVYETINRNKKSVALDLKRSEGREAFYKLVTTADVMLEGFRPRVAGRLKIDYDTLISINPGLIYCSISGYGQNGPGVDKVGHDLNYAGEAGLLALSSDRQGHPAVPGTQVGDLGSALLADMAILMALLSRERTGRGQYLDISMVDSIAPFTIMSAAPYLATGALPTKAQLVYGQYACYNIYPTADGRYLTVAAVEQKFWRNLCETLHRPDWAHQQFDVAAQKSMIAELENVFRARGMEQWLAALQGQEVCVGPVSTIEEALSSQQSIARQLTVVTSGKKRLGFAIKMSATPASSRALAPSWGEHTEQVLRQFGYRDDHLAKLASDGVIKLGTVRDV